MTSMDTIKTRTRPNGKPPRTSRTRGLYITDRSFGVAAAIAEIESGRMGREYGAGRVYEEALDYWLAHSQRGASLAAVLRDRDGVR